eukprot:395247_1
MLTKKLNLSQNIKRCVSHPIHLSFSTVIHHQIHNNKVPNLLWKDHLETFVDNASLNKGNTNLESTTFIQQTTNKNLAIHKLIYEAKSSKEIVDIVQQNKHQITHGSVYGLSMNRCCKDYKDYKAIQHIMNTLLNQTNTRIEKVAFNIFFNYMTHCDSPELCVKYFDFMINKSKIKPDLFTFSALIKGCRHQGNVQLAEKYYHLMRQKYNIEPNEFVYNEMLTVYSKALHVTKAITLFKQYLNSFESKCSIVSFNVYLSVFASVGDVNGLIDTVTLMGKYGIKPDMITFTHLMKGYNTAKRPEKSLKIFGKVSNGLKWKPSPAQLFYKCVALCMMISKENNFEKKMELYLQIEEIVKYEFDKQNVKKSLIGRVIFEAAIFVYYDSDPMKIIDIFEEFVEKKLIGYMHKNCKSNEWMIDLHCFVPLQAQFILRYILGFKIQEFELDNVSVMTGIGKHASSKKESGKLQKFVMSELMSYNPPIKCTVDHRNKGVLLLDSEDLRYYKKNEMNCIRYKIMYPSGDWFVHMR